MLWAIKKFIGRYPLFHSTCAEETEYIRLSFGKDARIVQIPNFIEVPDEVESSAGKYILLLGRIHWKKGIDNLIRAVSMSEEFLRSEYVLKIAGKGASGYQKDLQELVSELKLEEKIIFVGQVEGEAKQKLLADAFWTIMPSHTENFGLVVLESLAQNTPVVASTGSPWEVLETEKLGFWRDNSPEELSRILTRIVEMDAAEYEAHRKRGRKFVKENFDMSQNIERWTDAYRSLNPGD